MNSKTTSLSEAEVVPRMQRMQPRDAVRRWEALVCPVCMLVKPGVVLLHPLLVQADGFLTINSRAGD
jgi:hypothetical protein